MPTYICKLWKTFNFLTKNARIMLCYDVWLFSFLGGSGIALSTICIPFVTPALRRICLPFVPATPIQLKNVQNALKQFGHKSGSKLVDIGSGDGRIVHLAAREGYKSHGIELNPWLILYSKYKSIRLGLRSSATFSRQDLWKSNLGCYDNIVIFGVEQMVCFVCFMYLVLNHVL